MSGRARRPGRIERIGIAMDADLLRRFDERLAVRGGGNRSEAIRDLVRDRLIGDGVDHRTPVVAAVSIVYDHHKRQLARKLTSIQHEHGDHVVSAMHVHLDRDRCLEVIVLRGLAATVRRIGERLVGEKGVLHGSVFLTRRL